MISIKNINLQIGDRNLKCDDNIIFNDSSITFVKGESGTGKTTLLYVLGMISKQSNYILSYDGIEVLDSNKEDLRRQEVGMLYQNFNMMEDLSLRDNLKLFSYINSSSFNETEINHIFSRLSLTLSLERTFGSLSGGEKQRFCLACILMKNPNVIICDEPTSALDKDNADRLMNILFHLSKDEGKTIIITTHSNEYDDLADNILYLKNDKICQIKNKGLKDYKETIKNKNCKELNSIFYLDMALRRIKKMFTHNVLIMIFTIIALCLSTFLLMYGETTEKEYVSYLNASVQSEVFLTPKSDSSVLKQEDIDYITSIPEVDHIYQIKQAYGIVELENGEIIQPVQIYTKAPFQNLKDELIAADSSLYDNVGQELMVKIGDSVIEEKLTTIYSLQKVNKYSNKDMCTIYVDDNLVDENSCYMTNRYVLKINGVNSYEKVASKIQLLTDDYEVASPYYYFQIMLRNLKEQQVFIRFTSIIIFTISLILFVMVQLYEVESKKKEMCIFQANGINKKHILKLEILESILKYLLLFILSLAGSYMLVFVANKTIIDIIKIYINFKYVLLLAVFIWIYIIIPSIASVVYFLKQSPEDELRALF